MPGETTTATPAVDTAKPATQQEPAPAVEDTTSPAVAEPETPESAATSADSGGLSDDLLARLELLAERSESRIDPEPAADPEEEPEPAPAPTRRAAAPVFRQAKPAPAPEGGINFDAAGMTRAMVEHWGEPAKEMAQEITGTIGSLIGQIEDLRGQLEQAQSVNQTIDEIQKKIAPLSEQVNTWQSAEQRQTARAVHGWFDKREGYADRYGKGDRSSHTATNKNWRMAVFNKAKSLMANADAEDVPMSLEEALAAAEHLKFRGSLTKPGAVQAVRAAVQKAARGISPDPAAGGGARKTNDIETPEQERERQIAAVRRVEARAAAGQRT